MILIPVPNAHFDGGFYNWGDIGELTIATNWVPWWQEGSSPGVLHRPEFKPETMRFEHGQKLFTTFSTHRGGIYQRVTLPAGIEKLQLTVDCQYWSHHTGGSGGGLAMRAGLDLGAGTDPYSGAIVWGPWHGQDDPDGWDGKSTKVLITETGGDFGQQVTIWLESRCRFPAKHNDAYFDNVQLWAEIEEEPEPEPDPPSGDLLAVLRSIDGHLGRIADAVEIMAL